MLCFKCLKNIPDKSARCPHCGQNFSGKSAANLSSDRGAPLKEGDQVGHYAIRELVGEGPIGRVYKVLDTQFDVLAALKILHPEFSRDRAVKNTTLNVFRSLNEFEAEQFVKIYDAGEADDKVYIATDYLEGLSLKRLIEVRSGSKFSWEEAEPIVDAVCSAIESMNPGEVHGDIKPENIVILPDAVKLTDLGLSRITAPDGFVSAQVLGGNVYMAPELATHADRLRTDPSVDVYALGVILFQLLTGTFPSEGSLNPSKVVPEVPAPIGKIVEKALQVHPDQRFSHVAEMHLDIARFSGKPEVAARVEIFLHDLEPRAPFEEIAEEPEAPPAPVAPPVQPPAPAPAAPVKSKSLFDDELLGDKETKKAPEIAPPPPAAKSKGPLFAILGVVAAAVVGGGIFMATRKSEPPPAAVTSAPVEAPAPVAKPPAPVKEAGPAKVTKDQAAHALARAEKSRDDAISVNAAKGAPDLFVSGMKLLREANDAIRAQGYAQAVSLSVSAEQAFSDAIIKGVQQSKAGKEAQPKGGEETSKQAVAAPEKKEKCPEGTQYVAGGSFVMGAPSDDPDRNPGEKYNETVQVSGFCIDKYEFPNVKGKLPLAGVNWAKAKQACESVKKRLCSEQEWEKACKGPKNLKFPYAASFDANKCNTEDAKGTDRKLAPSGAAVSCMSGYGVADMSGNLWEWTSSQLQTGLQDRVLRGGSYSRPDYHDRCANRYNSLPSVVSQEFGFRCCTQAND